MLNICRRRDLPRSNISSPPQSNLLSIPFCLSPHFSSCKLSAIRQVIHGLQSAMDQYSSSQTDRSVSNSDQTAEENLFDGIELDISAEDVARAVRQAAYDSAPDTSFHVSLSHLVSTLRRPCRIPPLRDYSGAKECSYSRARKSRKHAGTPTERRNFVGNIYSEGTSGSVAASHVPIARNRSPHNRTPVGLLSSSSQASRGSSGTTSDAKWRKTTEKYMKCKAPYSYFGLKERANEHRRGDSICLKCATRVTGTKAHDLNFHIMRCAGVSLETRRVIWTRSKSKFKPPLMEKPPPEISTAALNSTLGAVDTTAEDYKKEKEANTLTLGGGPMDAAAQPMSKRQRVGNFDIKSIHHCTAADAEKLTAN